MTTTAKIASKGTKATGITEEIAKRLHDNLGKTIIAIVEITSEARTEKKNGDEEVKLALGMIEVAPDGIAAEHVRELARSFHYERQLADGQLTIDDDLEPKVADVLANGDRFKPHPYLASTLSTEDEPVCDVCGHLETAAVHADRAALADPFATADDDTSDEDDAGPVEFDERPTGGDLVRLAHVHVTGRCIKNRHGVPCDHKTANPDDLTYDAHAFIDDGNGTCLECDQAEDSATHTDELATT